MKATGIIRRVDDLGRVSVPKEIRRTLHIHEYDPLEIYLEDGCIRIKKYQFDAELLESVRRLGAEIAETPDLKCSVELLQKVAEMEALLQPEKDDE